MMSRIITHTRFKRFIKVISTHTPLRMIFLLMILWLIFSAGVYLAENSIEEAAITSYGEALYWGIAPFTRRGMAYTPRSSIAVLIGLTWIILGSVLFYGIIVTTVTTYFTRPMQRPYNKSIDSHERRKFKRLDIFHVIEIKSYTTLLGLIRNFSYQGFSFEMDSVDHLQKENIEFKLKHPQSNLSVSLLGDLVWEKRVANKFYAGIKLRKIDKEIKDKWIEILCAIKNIPIDWFNDGKKSEILMSERKEEKSEVQIREKSVSETSEKNKIKLIRNSIIGLSISFFILLGIITFKSLRIPISNTYYQTTPKELDPREHLAKPENIIKKPVIRQVDSSIEDKDELSNTKKETQVLDNKSVIQKRPVNTQDVERKLNGEVKVDDQYASRLVYTIQIESLPKISDAQKQFNFILRSINEKNLNMLRIEEIGKYYTVRLGKFENYETAKQFLQEIKPQLSEAIIMKAHIKNDRLIRLYE